MGAKRETWVRHRLDLGMRNWIIAYARDNLWRVQSWYSLEDLIQEGFFCYCKCNLRYGNIENTKHFMVLVKRTFINKVHDLSRKANIRKGELTLDIDSPVFEILESEDTQFNTLLNQLPPEIIKMIRTLLKGKSRMKRFASGERETTNEFLCRLSGLDADHINIEEVIREHFAMKNQTTMEGTLHV